MAKRLLFLSLIFILSFVLVAPAAAQPIPVASVNTGHLNVRSGPGLQYGAVATLPFGFGVNLVARNDAGNWIFISLTNGVTGWVNVNYIYTAFPTHTLPVNETLSAAPLTPSGSVTGASYLVLYSSPSEQASVVTTVGLNQPFDLLGRSFDSMWAQIRLPDGTVGWVMAKYINTGVPVRSVSPTDGSVYAPPPPTYGGTSGGARTHLVVAGDTLFKISLRYGVSMYAIANANGIINLNRIYRGQRLIIP